MRAVSRQMLPPTTQTRPPKTQSPRSQPPTAMELLAAADPAASFQEAKNITHAQDTDSNLNPLRKRGDFQQLLKELTEERL